MRKIKQFELNIIEKIEMKCKKYHINSKIINFKILSNNLIILEIPSFYTFTEYIYFNGDKRNDIAVMLDIDEYLTNGIKSIFTRDIKITDDDYMKSLEEWDGALELEDL